MAKWKKTTTTRIAQNPRFFEGLDTGALYFRDDRGYYVCIVGRYGIETGVQYAPAHVNSGRGIRPITAGTTISIEI